MMQTVDANNRTMDESLIQGSPRNIRSLQVRNNNLNSKTSQKESTSAFYCDIKGKIPDLSNREEREERL